MTVVEGNRQNDYEAKNRQVPPTIAEAATVLRVGTEVIVTRLPNSQRFAEKAVLDPLRPVRVTKIRHDWIQVETFDGTVTCWAALEDVRPA